MSERDWNYVKDVVESAAKRCKKTPSLFEIQTAMAFWYFDRIKVDIAVIEVGMGGMFSSFPRLFPSLSLILILILILSDSLIH
jgi:dihydrofolate synthase/folylpolyglutamate synthase